MWGPFPRHASNEGTSYEIPFNLNGCYMVSGMYFSYIKATEVVSFAVFTGDADTTLCCAIGTSDFLGSFKSSTSCV